MGFIKFSLKTSTTVAIAFMILGAQANPWSHIDLYGSKSVKSEEEQDLKKVSPLVDKRHVARPNDNALSIKTAHPNTAPPGTDVDELARMARQTLKAQRDKHLASVHRATSSMQKSSEALKEKLAETDKSRKNNKNEYKFTRGVIQTKRVNHGWDGKKSGFEYTDYQITFDPRAPKESSQYMAFMSQMTEKGWFIDTSKAAETEPRVVMNIRFKKQK